MREATSSKSSLDILYFLRKSNPSSSSPISGSSPSAAAVRSASWAWMARRLLEGWMVSSRIGFTGPPPNWPPGLSPAPSPFAKACGEEPPAEAASAPLPRSPAPSSLPLSSFSSCASEVGETSPRAELLFLPNGEASGRGLVRPGVAAAMREGPRDGVAVVAVVPVPPRSSVRGSPAARKPTLRLRFLATDCCALNRMSSSTKGNLSKSSSSLSSSRSSAFWLAVKPPCPRFGDSEGSSGFKLTMFGRS
mmetsp:Transcript_51374/g.149199  ORF Transcript_51374/g.149199 Transcript_51374/m.149199 type:complete len:249 (-) Transcript_51374:976-1722(-)